MVIGCPSLLAAGKCQTACKPGSVGPCGPGDHSSGVPVARNFSRPTRMAGREGPWRRAPATSMGLPPAIPIRPCSRWGLPCRPCRQGRGGLLPHRFTLTREPFGGAGGLFSVALSLGSPPPVVNRHRLLVEPGLSSAAPRNDPWGLAAVARPSGAPGMRLGRGRVKRRMESKVQLTGGCATRGLPSVPATVGPWPAAEPGGRPLGLGHAQSGRVILGGTGCSDGTGGRSGAPALPRPASRRSVQPPAQPQPVVKVSGTARKRNEAGSRCPAPGSRLAAGAEGRTPPRGPPRPATRR